MYENVDFCDFFFHILNCLQFFHRKVWIRIFYYGKEELYVKFRELQGHGFGRESLAKYFNIPWHIAMSSTLNAMIKEVIGTIFSVASIDLIESKYFV